MFCFEIIMQSSTNVDTSHSYGRHCHSMASNFLLAAASKVVFFFEAWFSTLMHALLFSRSILFDSILFDKIGSMEVSKRPYDQPAGRWFLRCIFLLFSSRLLLSFSAFGAQLTVWLTSWTRIDRLLKTFAPELPGIHPFWKDFINYLHLSWCQRILRCNTGAIQLEKMFFA